MYLFSYVCRDQIRCLAEIESDMVWRKVPMDRLLCGDVGFGKTEVALRAMFRCVFFRYFRGGKKVAKLFIFFTVF